MERFLGCIQLINHKAVSTIPERTKMQHLRAYLKSNGTGYLQANTSSQDDYQSIWKTLLEWFNKPSGLFLKYLDSLITMKSYQQKYSKEVSRIIASVQRARNAVHHIKVQAIIRTYRG